MQSDQLSRYNSWEITLKLDERSMKELKIFLSQNPLVKVIQIRSDELNIQLRQVNRTDE
jgi:hypothetical protein